MSSYKSIKTSKKLTSDIKLLQKEFQLLNSIYLIVDLRGNYFLWNTQNNSKSFSRIVDFIK